MRAGKVKDKDLDKIKFPVWASPKFDGIRGIIKDGVVLSNTLIPIPNGYIQDVLGYNQLNGLDGELFVRDNFNVVASSVMSEGGKPDFEFQVFDIWNLPTWSFEDRMNHIAIQIAAVAPDNNHIKICRQELCYNVSELIAFEVECLEAGYEGICFRHYQSPYKYGRGTLSDGCLYKRKPFEDGEAVITGFEEQEENTNDAQLDERGLSKRSHHSANKIGKDTLGAILCYSSEFGDIRLGSGTGLTKELRQFIWDNQELFLNKFVTYKFQRMGSLNKPRIAILDKESSFEFSRMRDYRDIAQGD
jgi:DNA ligase-1